MGNGGRILLGVSVGAVSMLLANSLLHRGAKPTAVPPGAHPSSARFAPPPSTPSRVPTITRAPPHQWNSVKAAVPVKPESKSAKFMIGESTLQQDRGLRSAPLNALLSALTVRCDFDPGAGAYWSVGDIHTHGVSYSGGEIVYQAIDIGDGTAQMAGTPGATGSSTGEIDVRVAANNAGLHFVGFTPAGSLVVTSVYASVDQSGRYMAVMSSHGQAAGHESIQVYGACDLSVSR